MDEVRHGVACTVQLSRLLSSTFKSASRPAKAEIVSVVPELAKA